MTKKTKLELWLSFRGSRHILIEDPAKSYHAKVRREGDIFDNMLIKGDNLLALKALEQDYAGKVKCVYIDPPFNTGQAFEHYDDGVEHSLWLSLMGKRAQLLHSLLRSDGTLFVHLDMEEVHYFKVYLDEIFGRSNFLGQIAYERSGVSGLGQGGSFLVNTHEFILCYAKDKAHFSASDLTGGGEIEEKDMKRYNRVMRDPGQRYEITRFKAPSTNEDVIIYRHENYTIDTISLRKYSERRDEITNQYLSDLPRVFRGTSIQKENHFQNRIIELCGEGLWSADYLVSRGKKAGDWTTAYFMSKQACVWLSEIASAVDGKLVRTSKLSDFWSHSDIPKANLANEGGVDFRRGKKPEELISRLLRMSTETGDLVLDSFGGSGTTGAVAHKMGRRWIMVEIGDHADTHVVPRLQKVIDGTDQGGISKAVDWKGGGGFRYFTLAPSLLEHDLYGNWIIAKDYNPAMLAEAMCKHMGFAYAPSLDAQDYWRHGASTETDFIYVTTQALTHETCARISHDVGPDRSLLICCKAFDADADAFENLTLVKIPTSILQKCEWGRDDYSLNIQNLPEAHDAAEEAQTMTEGLPLFAGEAGDE